MNGCSRDETLAGISFLIMALVGCSTIRPNQACLKEEALAKVERLGGTVQLDTQNPDLPVITASLSDAKITDAEL